MLTILQANGLAEVLGNKTLGNKSSIIYEFIDFRRTELILSNRGKLNVILSLPNILILVYIFW